jgi:hypothetical protein
MARWSSVKGNVMRATRIDECGKWATGASASVISAGFVKIDLSPQIEAGTEFIVKGADGHLCVNDKDCDQLKGLDLTIDLCQVDPAVFELMGGDRLITSGATRIGWGFGEDLRCTGGFALEVWTQIAGGVCGAAAERYIYWLFPWVSNGLIKPGTIENGPMTFSMTGRTKANPNWGPGPYQPLAGPAALPGQGTLVSEHLVHVITSVAPPTDIEGYVTQATVWVAPTRT